MNFPLLLNIAQIIIALLLIGAILLQQRGSGLSAAFGGDSSVYHTRRGVEKGVFAATIVLAALFFIFGLLNLVIR